ncbi:hypothetical protein [Amycolatopsis sp. NBC_01480]|uniref:hypothetical protein n=1 Tax=Amycolatopsis sp. NBC_01480 TaxID=2903562 RepID=UPI002E2D8827|nr:hypothetical protein [Amycolatopsis sp. NBC_01480]
MEAAIRAHARVGRTTFTDPSIVLGRQIASFFGVLVQQWNHIIDASTRMTGHIETPHHAKLLDLLFECEQQIQQGLGVGHSLIGTAIVERVST